ncbi:AraC family transcriptional regulator [Dyella japonica DSM 16301]|uniref:AraC family transcriptional regulator n=2 Tax=Dyella japonica TaxID=231455 RepID=A0A0G9H5Q2_9GAMM|nr:AraC family transcriptional regulator [Dyella japonica DSM 16301]
MLENPAFMPNRSGMLNDPLSDVLKLANVQSLVTGGFAASGQWAIRFPAPDKIKFFAAVRGACWLQLEGEASPLRLEPGDVILLAAKRNFVLASDLTATPHDSHELFAGRSEPMVAVDGVAIADADVVQIGGHVHLHHSYGALLADVLPTYIHVHGAAPEAQALRWILDQLQRERADLPGSSLATMQLGYLLFIQVLRAHLAAGGALRAGWLRAATDARLAPALRLIHGEPGRAWRLDQLARAAAMSRTSFATHFKAVAGEAPLSYLTRWRMRLAEQALRRGDAPVATLAETLGYASESAFSHAFKRVVGLSPRHYGEQLRDRGADDAARAAVDGL